MLSVSPVTTTGLVEPMSLGDEAAPRGSELERPEESVDLLEMWADSVDLVDNVLDTMDTQVTQVLGDQSIISQGDSRSVNLQVASLVHQLSNGGQRRVSERDVRRDRSKHLGNRAVNLQENTVVKLLQSEKLQDLSGLGGHLVDTDESCHKQELRLGFNEEVPALSGLTSHADEISLTSSVLLEVLDGPILQLLTSLSRSLRWNELELNRLYAYLDLLGNSLGLEFSKPFIVSQLLLDVLRNLDTIKHKVDNSQRCGGIPSRSSQVTDEISIGH